jgi:hypothetical protein
MRAPSFVLYLEGWSQKPTNLHLQKKLLIVLEHLCGMHDLKRAEFPSKIIHASTISHHRTLRKQIKFTILGIE